MNSARKLIRKYILMVEDAKWTMVRDALNIFD